MTSNGWTVKLHLGPFMLKGDTMTVIFLFSNIKISYYKSVTLTGV